MKKLNLILIQIAEALLSLFIPEEVRIEVIYAETCTEFTTLQRLLFLSALAKDMQFVKPNSNYTYSGGRLFQCCNS